MTTAATPRETGDFLTTIRRGGEGVVKRRDDTVDKVRHEINWNAIGVILAFMLAFGGFGIWVINASLAPIQKDVEYIKRQGESVERRLERLEGNR